MVKDLVPWVDSSDLHHDESRRVGLNGTAFRAVGG